MMIINNQDDHYDDHENWEGVFKLLSTLWQMAPFWSGREDTPRISNARQLLFLTILKFTNWPILVKLISFLGFASFQLSNIIMWKLQKSCVRYQWMTLIKVWKSWKNHLLEFFRKFIHFFDSKRPLVSLYYCCQWAKFNPWCHSLMSLSGVTLWCHSLVSLSGVALWCHSLVSLSGVTLWCYSLVSLSSVTLWWYSLVSLLWHQLHRYCLSDLEWLLWHQLHWCTEWKFKKLYSGAWSLQELLSELTNWLLFS